MYIYGSISLNCFKNEKFCVAEKMKTTLYLINFLTKIVPLMR